MVIFELSRFRGNVKWRRKGSSTRFESYLKHTKDDQHQDIKVFSVQKIIFNLILDDKARKAA